MTVDENSTGSVGNGRATVAYTSENAPALGSYVLVVGAAVTHCNY